MRNQFTVWFGSVAPSNDQRWWVLDEVAEAKWGWLAKPAAGPFTSVEAADDACFALNTQEVAAMREP